MTTVPRRALWRPRSLTDKQLGDLEVTLPDEPIMVKAWIAWDQGAEELLTGQATAWTTRAVRVLFGIPPAQYEVWVWANAVTRV